KIIKKLVLEAKKENKKSVLLTFFPHPKMVLQKDASIKLINTIDERAKHLEKIGLDYLIIHPFTKDFSRLTALEFVKDILVNQFNISKLIIGYDHHFGKNREGNIKQLTEYSHLYDFKVEEIPVQDIDEVAVSSTKIRQAILNGNIETANAYLGSNFTANIKVLEDYKLIPKTGAYVVKSVINNKTIFGMMNIGKRPTVDGNYQTIEVHFFDFSSDLYNTFLNIEVLHFLREEQKFNSVEELVAQLKKDEKKSKEL
ncbi:MAG: riboflavin biosynthesis protein RibF, partial [Polaribacter sp.]